MKKALKIPKNEKCFQENGAVQNAIKDRTTKNCVEDDLSKLLIKQKEKTHIKDTVKMSRHSKELGGRRPKQIP